MINVSEKQWNKYSIESLDFILEQSEKLIDETFKTFRTITDKCYYALGIYLAVFSFCINQILHNNIGSNAPYLVIICGLSFCIFKLFYTLLPGKLTFPGTHPEELLITYFETIPLNEQLSEIKIYTIAANNNGFIKNRIQIDSRISKFKLSVIVFIATLIIALFSFYCPF